MGSSAWAVDRPSPSGIIPVSRFDQTAGTAGVPSFRRTTSDPQQDTLNWAERSRAAVRRQTGELVLCADDFGLSDGISEAILQLGANHQLNATTCMVEAAPCADHALALAALPQMAIGLHLVLCEDPLMPCTVGRLPPLPVLERAVLLGTLDVRAFRRCVERQFDLFEKHFGRAPDFVDGHRNAHVMPGLRALVLSIMQRRSPRAWLRSCEDRLGAMLRRPFRSKAVASALWSVRLNEIAAEAGIATNDSFAGHYDFAADYGALLPRFLEAGGAFHLVMCHPGGEPLPDDPIGTARLEETRCLSATDMTQLAAAAGMRWR